MYIDSSQEPVTWLGIGDGREAGTQTKLAAPWLIFRRDVNANHYACQSPRLNWCQQERQVVEQARKRQKKKKKERVPEEENTISTFTSILIRFKVMLRLLHFDQFCLG